jgi:hypothetical protein
VTRPAVVAGFVGVGVAVIVVIGFALVLAVQVLVFLLALPVGLLIGWYAVERERAATATRMASGATELGWPRALGSGVLAGFMTGLALAALYVLVRLVFLYLDTGFRAGGPPYTCAAGPECGYQRALDEPTLRAALDEAGVNDAAGYAGYFLEGQALGGAALVVLVLAGALIGSAVHRARWAGTPASTIVAEGPP